ncbi:MAG: transcription repressor NadR [Bacillota bacterium]|nr:transcription repressor NadR [Bacillota bacterium]
MKKGTGEEERASDERRRRLEALVREARGPVRGTQLAERLGVSRQVVVQDIAVLRARGSAIRSSPRGYVWDEPPEPATQVRAQVAVRHTPEETALELHSLVDAGVRVVDVVVEHPLYGELRGYLDLATHEQVDAWLEEVRRHRASLLSSLTGGVHLHTLESRDAQGVARARRRLEELGFLLL